MTLAWHPVKGLWDEGRYGPHLGASCISESCITLLEQATTIQSDVSSLVGWLTPRPGWEIGSVKKRDLFRSISWLTERKKE